MQLPIVRGAYREGADLKKTNWFGVGGPAEVLFKPSDVQDLADFMKGCPAQVPITVIGVGSNLIVRDGGVPGVVIRLGRGFTDIELRGNIVIAGAAAMDLHVARMAAESGRGGLEFLSGIPGTIGGALAMNGGAYGAEMKDVLMEAELVLRDGTLKRMGAEELQYSYRHSVVPEGAVFTRAWLSTQGGDAGVLKKMEEIAAAREATQPIRERTGGSTFKNPIQACHPGLVPGSPGKSACYPGIPGQARDDSVGGGMTGVLKAWQLIDAAGCRGLTIGGAQMSELHCNFMINTGGASAKDLEALGEEVRARVKAHSGVELEWEIKRIGESL